MALTSVRTLVLAVAGVVLAVAACKREEPFVPAPTTITVTPGSRAFGGINQSQQFNATVADQRGTTMSGVTPTWTSSSGTVASVNTTGLVTAQGSGSATITARAGNATGQASVTVTQIAAALLKHEGDFQSASVGAMLPLAVTARVVDSGGTTMGAGVGVTFTPSSGGSVGSPNVTTNAQGLAITTWTLGTTAGLQQLSVTSAGLTPIAFTATAVPEPADTVIKHTPDATNVPAGTAVVPSPAVRLLDSLDNPVSGVGVTFAVIQGGGQVIGAQQVTNASGIATVGQWIVGTSGVQQLQATVAGLVDGGNPVTFNATIMSPGPPASVTVQAGNNQTGLIGYPLNVRPAVIVRDAASNPVQGVTVDFEVTAGGGSISGDLPTTDLTGVARVGGWTVQTGANTLTATVSGVATPATFTATGVASTFNIEVQYLTQLDSAHRAAFDSAAARWSRVVFGDLPAQNVMFNQGGPSGTPCARPEVPATNRSVDDVLIFAIVQPIDGPFNILGSAGPCILRGSSNLPAVGIMRFDEEDLDFLHTNNLLRPVILHEMAHVLGFGTLWNFGIFNLLSGAGQADPFFTGAQARAAFDQNGGAGYAGGGKVPVENTGGPGTRDGHWRETVFDSELMTGFIDGGTQLSVITAASFADMGYQLNFAGSDPFTVPFPAALRAASGPQVHLVDDILHGAVHVVDPAGRVLRVLQRR